MFVFHGCDEFEMQFLDENERLSMLMPP